MAKLWLIPLDHMPDVSAHENASSSQASSDTSTNSPTTGTTSAGKWYKCCKNASGMPLLATRHRAFSSVCMWRTNDGEAAVWILCVCVSACMCVCLFVCVCVCACEPVNYDVVGIALQWPRLSANQVKATPERPQTHFAEFAGACSRALGSFETS